MDAAFQEAADALWAIYPWMLELFLFDCVVFAVWRVVRRKK